MPTLARSNAASLNLIDSKTHGIVDYCHAAFFFTVGFICLRSNKRAAAASLATGSFVLVQSLLTDYPVGVNRVLPFATHGSIDAIFAASSWLVPHLFGFAGTAPAHIFDGNSIVEATAVALTDWDSKRAHDAGR